MQSGNFAVIHPKTMGRIIFHPRFHRVYASALLATNEKIYWVPCPRGNRYEGVSKMSFGCLLMHGLDLLLPLANRITRRCAIFFGFLFSILFSIFAFAKNGSISVPESLLTPMFLIAAVSLLLAGGTFLVSSIGGVSRTGFCPEEKGSNCHRVG